MGDLLDLLERVLDLGLLQLGRNAEIAEPVVCEELQHAPIDGVLGDGGGVLRELQLGEERDDVVHRPVAHARRLRLGLHSAQDRASRPNARALWACVRACVSG